MTQNLDTKMAELNANSPIFQFIMLVLICIIPIGSYYGMDSPSPLETQIKTSLNGSSTNETFVADLSHSDYTMLYEIYTIPNIILCFFAGYFIDSRWGRRKAAIICSSVVATGGLCVALGCWMNSLILAYVGRFIFGIGSESVALCEYAYNIHWFDRTKIDPKKSSYKPFIGLSFAFSIAISFSRASSFLAFETLGRSYEAFAGVNKTATALARYGDKMIGGPDTDCITCIPCDLTKRPYNCALSPEDKLKVPTYEAQRGFYHWDRQCQNQNTDWNPANLDTTQFCKKEEPDCITKFTEVKSEDSGEVTITYKDSEGKAPTADQLEILNKMKLPSETVPNWTEDDFSFEDCDKSDPRKVCIYNAAPANTGKAFFVAFLVAAFTLCICVLIAHVDILGNRWRKRTAKEKAELLDGDMDDEQKALKSGDQNVEANTKQAEEADDDAGISMITWEDIKGLSLSAWLIMLICSCYYMTIFPFIGQGVEYFKIYRGETNDDYARRITGLIVTLSGFGVSPLIGMCIDFFCFNGLWLLFGIGCTVFGHWEF